MAQPNDEKVLGNVNKIAILVLSAAGFLLDGPDPADALFLGSMVVWLWMSVCIQVEQRLLNMYVYCFNNGDSQDKTLPRFL